MFFDVVLGEKWMCKGAKFRRFFLQLVLLFIDQKQKKHEFLEK